MLFEPFQIALAEERYHLLGYLACALPRDILVARVVSLISVVANGIDGGDTLAHERAHRCGAVEAVTFQAVTEFHAFVLRRGQPEETLHRGDEGEILTLRLLLEDSQVKEMA